MREPHERRATAPHCHPERARDQSELARCRCYSEPVSTDVPVRLVVETEREEDGRWITEVVSLPGVMAYGRTRDEALARTEALALRALAGRVKYGEDGPDLSGLFDVA
jgi:predicted RNase H-like HicB family nuclease